LKKKKKKNGGSELLTEDFSVMKLLDNLEITTWLLWETF
jgi:hypothetical protein